NRRSGMWDVRIGRRWSILAARLGGGSGNTLRNIGPSIAGPGLTGAPPRPTVNEQPFSKPVSSRSVVPPMSPAAAARPKPVRGTRVRARAAVPRGDKRDAILRAAIRTFARSGFFGAQVADVARAAGVAAGTVYLYFRSKDDLPVSIFEGVMTEAIAEGRAALAGIPDPLQR